MSGTLRGRRALVTGAADGLGKAYAIALAQAGAAVAVCDVAESVHDVAKHIASAGVQSFAMVADVADARQVNVEGWRESAGQLVVLPVQFSATSQEVKAPFAEAAGRQMSVAGFTTSAGQAALVPLQVSGTSQAPADERQTVPADSSTSLSGQSAFTPSQFSAMSQAPASRSLQTSPPPPPVSVSPPPRILS